MKSFSFGRKLMAAATLLSLASCASEAPWGADPADGGKISLRLSTDVEVYTSTRANDKESPVRPDGDRFKIKLESTDKSYSKIWDSLIAFNKEEAFPKGAYTITASYGDLDKEGFENPYYVGSENVSVVAGENSSVAVNATLANSMVSVRYDDSFKSVFGNYSAVLTSTVGEPLSFVKDEERPAYVKPGNVEVSFILFNPDNPSERVNVSPASFTAMPRRHYIVTVKVTNNNTTGNQELNVEFDESVVKETFPIVLGDELFSAPAPTVTLKGVGGESSSSVDTFEGVSLGEINPEFHVFAYGGIKKATFTVNAADGGALPGFGGSVELVNAAESDKSLINSSGLGCYGFFQNADKVAVLNMKKFIEGLNPGNYTMSLNIVDAIGRTTDIDNPVSLKTSVKEVRFSLDGYDAPAFMSNELAVMVSTNYTGAKDGISFHYMDDKGESRIAEIKSVTPVDNSGVSADSRFKYVLGVSNITDSQFVVEASYPKKSSQKLTVDVNMPEFSVEVDAFATRAMFKIVPEDASQLANIVENIKVFDKNGALHLVPSSRDKEAGIIMVKGLTAGTLYDKIGFSLGSDYSRNNLSVTFTTETAAQIPNGEFNETATTINLSDIQVGGEYRVLPVDYHHKSSIVRDTPNGWSNVNALTCYSGSNNKNTWFLVPSTFVESGKVCIRTVGYNHNGTTPVKSGGAFNTKYYCENAPSDNQLEKASGELFLGTYSYDGSEHRSDGIVFGSRPDYISFDYEYTGYKGEHGEMYVQVLDQSGKVLVSNKMNLTDEVSGVKQVKLPLEGYVFGENAASIRVCFRSTASDITPSVNIPSGSALNESQSLGNHTIDANKYHAFAMGSELKIDNVKLGYGDSEQTRSSRRGSK